MLDAWWPNPPLRDDKRVIIVHKREPLGVRNSMNAGVRLAKGKYIMKSDDHCMFKEGFDEVLKKDLEDHWISVPSRYSLDAEKWERTRGPIEYLCLTYPYIKHRIHGYGLHGAKWLGEHGLEGSYWHLERERKDIKIDDLMMFQGSCYFTTKSHWESIDGLDEENHYVLFGEAIELSLKTWISGGRVIRYKNTWYAHLHKTKEHKPDFRLSRSRKIQSAIYDANYWMNNKWPKQIHDIKWLVDKFGPIDGWPETWDIRGYDYSKWYER